MVKPLKFVPDSLIFWKKNKFKFIIMQSSPMLHSLLFYMTFDACIFVLNNMKWLLRFVAHTSERLFIECFRSSVRVITSCFSRINLQYNLHENLQKYKFIVGYFNPKNRFSWISNIVCSLKPFSQEFNRNVLNLFKWYHKTIWINEKLLDCFYLSPVFFIVELDHMSTSNHRFQSNYYQSVLFIRNKKKIVSIAQQAIIGTIKQSFEQNENIFSFIIQFIFHFFFTLNWHFGLYNQYNLNYFNWIK